MVPHSPHDIQHTTLGNTHEIQEKKKKISIEEIIPEDSTPTLLLLQGPSGIGKSTLAWEVCRRWDRIPSMKYYSLVLLLRLKESYVQHINCVKDLFLHADKELQQSVTREVLDKDGRGVLFVMDGFDDLPEYVIRHEGLLIRIIKGIDLPQCTVLITSRPSATSYILTNCSPQIQEHFEILGFTPVCINEYASSIFSSEPDISEDVFLQYISSNPAICSLMHIPLNAAIVAEVYRNSQHCGFPPPVTHTQLYTQLCLIILQRHSPHTFSTHLKDFTHFAKLTESAYEGFRKKDTSPDSDLVPTDHYGFISAMPPLYEGGQVRYNFFHPIIQEFLAAYYICNHTFDIEVFRQYYREERWHTIWRFVAGLTKFKYFEKIWHNELFEIKKSPKSIQVTQLFIHCLFEAQTQFDYKSTYGVNSVQYRCNSSPLDRYALGYCIASSTASWIVELFSGFIDSLVWGLNSTGHCSGTVTKLTLNKCSLSLGALRKSPRKITENITHLRFTSCWHVLESNPMPLAEAITFMTNINTLELCYNQLDEEVMNIFEQLHSSKVSNLCYNRNYCTNIQNQEFFTVLKVLLHPSTGTITTLQFGQHELSKNFDPKILCKIFFTQTTLQKLTVSLHEFSSLSLLETNTNLVKVSIKWKLKPSTESLVKILQNNKILRKMSLEVLEDVDMVRSIVNALHANKTLQKLFLKVDKVLFCSICELTQNDSRICWRT